MNRETIVASAVPAPGRVFPRFLRNLGRRNCLLITLAFAAITLAVNAGELAAVGVPPLLLSILPCLAICALGLCKRGGKDGSGCSRPVDSASSANVPRA